MKYFNHLSCAGEDGKIQALRDEFKIVGYGVYFLVLEKIASQIRKESGDPSLTLSLRKWSHHVDLKTGLTLKVIRKAHDLGLWTVSGDNNSLTITAPNLLKYADEYSKKVGIKSRHSPDKSPDIVPNPGSKEVRKDKRSTAARPRADGADAPKAKESTDEIEDPKARAEAMKAIREATGQLEPKPKVVEPQGAGNGKIPTAEGPEVDEAGLRLQDAGFVEPFVQDVLNAWWAHKVGTHDVYALAGVLDRHGVKGHDRSKVYSILGVV